MSEWTKVILSDVLKEKGYIRGPFGSALKRGDMKELVFRCMNSNMQYVIAGSSDII